MPHQGDEMVVRADGAVTTMGRHVRALLDPAPRLGQSLTAVADSLYPDDRRRTRRGLQALVDHPHLGGRVRARTLSAAAAVVDLDVEPARAGLRIVRVRSGAEVLVAGATAVTAGTVDPALWPVIVARLPVPAALVAEDGTVVQSSPGLRADGERARDLVHPADAALLDDLLAVVRDGGLDEVIADLRAVGPDGESQPSRLRATPVGAGALVVVEPAPAVGAFDEAACALVVVDDEGVITSLNSAAEQLSTVRHPTGQPARDAFPVAEGEDVEVLAADARLAGAPVERELVHPAPAGDARVLLWTAAPSGAGAVLSATDVTSLHRHTRELAHQAFHDPLTGLPNRSLLQERLALAVRRHGRAEGELAVLFVDLNHFKEVNDTLGHDAGDRLLVDLAGRLQAVLRPADTVARVGGDEFVLVCEDVADGAAVLDIAERVTAAVERPFDIDGSAVTVSVAVGIALARHSGPDPANLLRDADAAMYRAKEKGRALPPPPRPRSTRATAPELASPAPPVVDAAELRRALAEGELSVAFQPQIDLREGRLVGAEALVRWQHPSHGLLLPMSFLGLAEASGLVVELGRQVLATACRRAALWGEWARAADREAPVVAVNLSSRELADDGLVDAVAAALGLAGADPALLRIEVAERSLNEDPQVAVRALARLRALGVGVSVDAVGAAPPSLDDVVDLHVRELKVDASFARAPGAVAELVRRSATLDVRTVAVGLERDADVDGLAQMGYRAGQGRWFAGAQPAAVMDRLVESDLRWATSGPRPTPGGGSERGGGLEPA